MAKRRAFAEIDAMRITATLFVLLAAACASPAASPPPHSPAAVALDVALRDANVVYFGELHDDRRHHAYQLQLLERMGDAAANGAPVLLGMEMFQRGFQEPLDDYVAGRIDEREMLRRTEYFKRWNFDYTMYAPLWRWCREHGGRVVALNADGPITRKIGRKGLADLTPDERCRIAADIDLGNAAHRARIMETFTSGAHKMPDDQLQRLYEAMTVWDETMAESAADALAAAGPGARMLVVAGRGHVESGTGIPDRVDRRRPGLKRVVVVGETAESAETPEVAHAGGQFVVAFPPRADEAGPPRLGVEFAETPAPQGPVVKAVSPGGNAAAAGVAAGDVLCRFGGAALFDTTDLRYLLDVSRFGDAFVLEGLRDGAPVSFTVTLAPPPPPPAESAAKP